MSGARSCRNARSVRSPFCLALRARGGPPAPRLRATTTAADFSRRRVSTTRRLPFRNRARSPQVRSIDYPCTSAGSTKRFLGRESFAVTCPLALIRPASHPVSVRRSTGLATRFFQHSPHGRRLAVHSGRRDQLPRGLPPPSRCSCWAHNERSRRESAGFFVSDSREKLLSLLCSLLCTALLGSFLGATLLGSLLCATLLCGLLL